MRRPVTTVVLRAAAFIVLGCLVPGASPALAQEGDDVPTLRTEEVRKAEAAAANARGPAGDAGDLCREARERRDSYLGIWKSQFLKRNRMDPAYFDAHVTVVGYDVECGWVSGLSFRVEYTVRFDWAAIEAQDQLVILLYEKESACRHLPIVRDRLFDEPEVALAIDKGVFFASISTVKPAGKLAFTNREAALEAFRAKAGTRELDDVRLAFHVPGNVPRIDGRPYLLARGVVDAKKNLCVEGHVNLVTGEVTTRTNACVMHQGGVQGGVGGRRWTSPGSTSDTSGRIRPACPSRL